MAHTLVGIRKLSTTQTGCIPQSPQNGYQQDMHTMLGNSSQLDYLQEALLSKAKPE